MGGSESATRRNGITFGALLTSDMDTRALAIRLCGLLNSGITHEKNMEKIDMLLKLGKLSEAVLSKTKLNEVAEYSDQLIAAYDVFHEYVKDLGEANINLGERIAIDIIKRRTVDEFTLKYFDILAQYDPRHIIVQKDTTMIYTTLTTRLTGFRSYLNLRELFPGDHNRYGKDDIIRVLRNRERGIEMDDLTFVRYFINLLNDILTDPVSQIPKILKTLHKNGYLCISYRNKTYPTRIWGAELAYRYENDKTIFPRILESFVLYDSILKRTDINNIRTYLMDNPPENGWFDYLLEDCVVLPSVLHCQVYACLVIYKSKETHIERVVEILMETSEKGAEQLFHYLHTRKEDIHALVSNTHDLMSTFLNGQPVRRTPWKRIRFIGIVNDGKETKPTDPDGTSYPSVQLFKSFVSLAQRMMTSADIAASVLFADQIARSRSVDVNALLSLFDTRLLNILNHSIIALSIDEMYRCLFDSRYGHFIRFSDSMLGLLPLCWDTRMAPRNNIRDIHINRDDVQIDTASRYVIDRFVFSQGIKAFSVTAPPYIDDFEIWLLAVMESLSKRYVGLIPSIAIPHCSKNGGCFIDINAIHTINRVIDPIKAVAFKETMEKMLPGIEFQPDEQAESAIMMFPNSPDIRNHISAVDASLVHRKTDFNDSDDWIIRYEYFEPYTHNSVNHWYQDPRQVKTGDKPVSMEALRNHTLTQRIDEFNGNDFDYIYSYASLSLSNGSLRTPLPREYVFAACRACKEDIIEMVEMCPSTAKIIPELPIRGVIVDHDTGCVRFETLTNISVGKDFAGNPMVYPLKRIDTPMEREFASHVASLKNRPFIPADRWNLALVEFANRSIDPSSRHSDELYSMLLRANDPMNRPLHSDDNPRTLHRPVIEAKNVRQNASSKLLFGGKNTSSTFTLIFSIMIFILIVIAIGIIYHDNQSDQQGGYHYQNDSSWKTIHPSMTINQ